MCHPERAKRYHIVVHTGIVFTVIPSIYDIMASLDCERRDARVPRKLRIAEEDAATKPPEVRWYYKRHIINKSYHTFVTCCEGACDIDGVDYTNMI